MSEEEYKEETMVEETESHSAESTGEFLKYQGNLWVS